MRSFELLSQGHHESSIREAFKHVEIEIRQKSGLGSENGVKLIRMAFHPQNGPLTNMTVPEAEREALSNYISGVYGLYRNPCSHRDVDLGFEETFEILVIASNILKIIENTKV
jgi:uncharacterized protein (TIGR02391 family)